MFIFKNLIPFWKPTPIKFKSMSTLFPHKKLVVISGCDSGLGLSMAKWASDAGYPVLAGCLSKDGEGAKYLTTQAEGRGQNKIFVHGLDVTQKQSLDSFAQKCLSLLENFELHALILNAAVAVPGEFFWLTESQGKSHMDVNFWGAVNLTSTFQSLLLNHQSRVIVISSDCAQFALPGLAIYCASKAAIESWAMAFRLEVAKYGISVVCFHPGDFATKSRMMTGQLKNFEEMRNKMDPNLVDFYGKTVEDFQGHYVNSFDKTPPPIEPVPVANLKQAFLPLLTQNVNLKPRIIYESWSQKLFHFLVKFLPQFYSDSLLLKILNSPKWQKQTTIKN